MPCYSPLSAYKSNPGRSDKTVLVFSRPMSWRAEEVKLPCGQCVGCRLERSRQWAVRCMHEASLYDENCFITLTYDDENIPVGEENCRRCVKEHVIGGSVCKADFQDFLKRLRKRYGSGIRYYHCGEYGENFGRPHYHALLFNHDFQDKKFFSSRGGNTVYTSDSLSDLWPFGFSVVGGVTFESASYVARYVMKKVTGKRAEEHYGGKTPEYTTMSRGSKKLGTGGIGKAWFERYKGDVYPRDGVVVRGRVTRPPKYYDDLFGREDPSALALIKIQREFSGKHFVEDVLSDGTVLRVDDGSLSRLRVKEVVKLAEIQTLKRPLED